MCQGANYNFDGLMLHSVPGLVFSNEISNFALSHGYFNYEYGGLHCDTLLDVANRRPCDLEWTGRETRVERNIFTRGLIKNEGSGDPGNTVVWANNIMTSASFMDYHGRWKMRFLHNSVQWMDDHNPIVKNYIFQDTTGGIVTRWSRYESLPRIDMQSNVFRGTPIGRLLQRAPPIAGMKLKNNLLFGQPGLLEYKDVLGGLCTWTKLFQAPQTEAENATIACNIKNSVRTPWSCYLNKTYFAVQSHSPAEITHHLFISCNQIV